MEPEYYYVIQKDSDQNQVLHQQGFDGHMPAHHVFQGFWGLRKVFDSSAGGRDNGNVCGYGRSAHDNGHARV